MRLSAGLTRHGSTGKTSRRLYARKTELYVDLIVNDLHGGDLSATGVERQFEEILQSGIQLAIGSACVKWVAERVLEASWSGSVGGPAAACAGDDVAAKKPDPSFISPSQSVAGRPEDCLVVEDTGHGLQALGAGMRRVVVPRACPKDSSPR